MPYSFPATFLATSAAVIGRLAVAISDCDAMRVVGVASFSAVELRHVWVALRANIREVLELVTLEDVVQRRLPPAIAEIAARPEVWDPR